MSNISMKDNWICSKCYTKLPEGSKRCYKCGTPFFTIAEQQQMRREKHAKKYSEYGNKIGTGLEVSLYGMFGIPIVSFGIMFMTMAIIVGFLKIPASPLNAIIGLIWGMLIGMIIFKIGEWVLKQIEDKQWTARCIQTGTVIGIIIGIIQAPYFLNIVSGFY